MTQRHQVPGPPPPLAGSPPESELHELHQQRLARLSPHRGGHWQIWTSIGAANVFHHYRPECSVHEVWVRHLTRPAIILGSGQQPSILDSAASSSDFEICQRRSGGGLVLLNPQQDVWIDVLVPAQSSLWDDDLARSFGWLGQVWAGVMTRLFPAAEVTIHSRSAESGGHLLCFGTAGYGEVSVGGHKVVGLSQRRTRNWARIQSAVIQRWPAKLLADLLAPGRDGADPLPDPHQMAAGLPAGLVAVPTDEVIEAFLDELARPRL